MAANTSETPPTAQSSGYLFRWPALPAIDDLQSIYAGIEDNWPQYPCPRALGWLPIEVPAAVAQFVDESTRKEVYLVPEDEDRGSDNAQGGVVSLIGGSCERLEQDGLDETAEDGGSDERDNGIGKDGGMNPWKSLARHLVPKKGDCVSCLESFPLKRLVTSPCQHRYCGECLKTMAFMAISKEQSFPPRCCSLEIPSTSISKVLTFKERKRYVTKALEYGTPPAERWYCLNPTCGKWIPPKYIKNEAAVQKCPYCKKRLCSACRSFAHGYEVCSRNPDIASLLHEAQRQHWQRCYRCSAMVERLGGSPQVTCRCSAVFCYGCGNPWDSKACACHKAAEDQDEDNRLQVQRENRGTGLSEVIVAIEDTCREGSGGTRAQEQDKCLQNQEEACPEEEQRRLEIDKQVKVLTRFLSKVNKLQQVCLIKRQKEEGIVLLTRQKSDVERFHHERAELLGKLERNLDTRMQKLISAQAAEFQKMEAEHEEQENDLIPRLPRFFRHQSNAEDRELAVLTKLRGIQDAEKTRLVLEHRRVVREAEEMASMERSSLLSSLSMEWDTQQLTAKSALQSLVQGFVYDRYWFDQAVAKRQDMLAKHRLGLISPSGLEDVAFPDICRP